MADLPIPIEGCERLVSIFGRWPSFHDAEVISIAYHRSDEGFDVRASIHVWETTGEVDENGHFVQKDPTVADIILQDCGRENLGGFNGQNVVFGLTFALAEADEEGRRIEVAFQPCYGLSGTVLCRSVAVLSARPFDVTP